MSSKNESEELKAVFDSAYNALNMAQKSAVDTIEGPVMVIAGPGTGKTQILTLRIANILLQTDTAPESILALTFTDSGAKAMRERLHRYIGSRAYRVPIYTFHGLAEKLIRDYPEFYDSIIGGRPASELEKISIVETILDNIDIKLLRPAGDPAYYVRPILRMISELKKEYVGPDALAKIISLQEEELDGMEKVHVKGAHKGKVKGDYTKKEQSINKNKELLFVYRSYDALLRTDKLYDFEDMITQTVLALEQNENMLRDLQEQYQYVLADEHQDVNGSQNKILEMLVSYHDSPNIFVVGDEKQAIYRFQGASLENFLFFEKRFVGTKTISLTENYRSGQTILDASHSLVAVEDGPLKALRIPLEAKSVPSSALTKREFSHQAVEEEWLVSEIKNKLDSGISPEEIAVIVRTNKEVESLTSKLRGAGLLVEASADGDILVHPVTQSVEALIAAVLTDTNESALFTLIHGAYWGLTLNDLVKITSARSYDTSLLSILSSVEKLSELKVENVDNALKIARVLEEARVRTVSQPPHRVLQFLLKESGMLDHVTAHDPFEGARVIRRLYDEVESLVLNNDVSTLRDVKEMFIRLRAYNVPLNAPYINTNLKAVQVMTAHKSKGLEFTVVFIPHLQDSIWGGGTKRNNFTIPLGKIEDIEFDPFDDEKRLLYVAMTRAKVELNFSSSGQNSAGKEIVATRLYDDIDSTFETVVDTSGLEELFNPSQTLQDVQKNATIDRGLILTSLTKRGFSATSLNNYLGNPWNYVYKNVLRIPEVQPTHMQFGTAVHSVLEFSTKRYSDKGSLPTDTEIKVKLKQALSRLPLSKNEFVRLLSKGMEVLYPYLTHLKQTLLTKTKEELNVKVFLETGLPELPELTLTGKLDRIDIGSDGLVVRVVDYKTGKPKSRNVIEGKTAGSDGGYKRQLVFYALLLKMYGDERYTTNVGVLSFVESASNGAVKEEAFSVTDVEVEDLRLQIIEAVKEIISGEFLANKELASESEYAHLAGLLFA